MASAESSESPESSRKRMGRPSQGVKLAKASLVISEKLWDDFKAETGTHVNVNVSRWGIYRFCAEEAFKDWIAKSQAESVACPGCGLTKHRSCFHWARGEIVDVRNPITGEWVEFRSVEPQEHLVCPKCHLRFQFQ